MCHILEHIERSDLQRVLTEMKRVLKKGGILRLSVPDFDKLIDVYNDSGKDINTITNQLMGGQDHKYNFHYTVFNYKSLSELCLQAGFKKVVSWNPENCLYHNFKDKANRKIKVNDKEHFISLNLEAVK